MTRRTAKTKPKLTECYQKQDWNKRARGMKTVFDHSARKITLAKGCGQKQEVEWYCGTVKKLLTRLAGKIRTAEEPKAFYILQKGFYDWLALIDYPVPEMASCPMLPEGERRK